METFKRIVLKRLPRIDQFRSADIKGKNSIPFGERMKKITRKMVTKIRRG